MNDPKEYFRVLKKRVTVTRPKREYRNTSNGEMITSTRGYKKEPIKRSKLRMTVCF